MAFQFKGFQSLRQPQLPVPLKNDLRELERYLRGIDQRLAQLNISEPLGGGNPNAGDPTLIKHAPTHATGGNDPIDPYAFVWKEAHEWAPTYPDIQPLKITPPVGQTATLLTATNTNGLECLELDAAGKLGLNDPIQDAIFNIRIGEATVLPSELDNVRFWHIIDEASPLPADGQDFATNCQVPNKTGDQTYDLNTPASAIPRYDANVLNGQGSAVVGTSGSVLNFESGAQTVATSTALTYAGVYRSASNSRILGSGGAATGDGFALPGRGASVSAGIVINNTLTSISDTIDNSSTSSGFGNYYHSFIYQRTTANLWTFYLDGVDLSNSITLAGDITISAIFRIASGLSAGAEVELLEHFFTNDNLTAAEVTGIQAYFNNRYTTGGGGDTGIYAPAFQGMTSGNAIKIEIDENLKLHVGGENPTNRLQVTDTTTPQVRISYDSVDYQTLSVADTTGILTIGANPTHLVSTTSPQLRLGYNGSLYTTIGVDNSSNTTISNAVSDTLLRFNNMNLQIDDERELYFGTNQEFKIRYDDDSSDFTGIKNLTFIGPATEQFLIAGRTTFIPGSVTAAPTVIIYGTVTTPFMFQAFDIVGSSTSRLCIDKNTYLCNPTSTTEAFTIKSNTVDDGINLKDAFILQRDGTCTRDALRLQTGTTVLFKVTNTGAAFFDPSGINSRYIYEASASVVWSGNHQFNAATSHFTTPSSTNAGCHWYSGSLGGHRAVLMESGLGSSGTTVIGQTATVVSLEINTVGRTSTTATRIVAAALDPTALSTTVDLNDLWGLWSKGGNHSGNLAARTFTNVGGLKIWGYTNTTTPPTITNWYGVYIEDIAVATNKYGLYLEENTGGTINNSIFTAGAGRVAFRDQDLYIDSATDGHLDLHADISIDINGDMDIADANDIILSGTTGTKFGTATTQKLGFYNSTPIVQPSAYTQTYSTADKTQANFTSADLAAFTGGLVGFLDAAERDNIRTQFNLLRADVADIKQITNSIIDDLQSLGLVG